MKKLLYLLFIVISAAITVFAFENPTQNPPLGGGALQIQSNQLLITKPTKVTGTNNFIVEGGNVGIGTTAPSEKLEVAGNVKASGTFAYFYIDSPDKGDLQIIGDAIFKGDAPLYISRSPGNDYLRFSNTGLDAQFIVPLKVGTAFDTMNILLNTDGSASFSGNVGIGTTGPQFGRLMIEHDSVPLSFRETGVAVDAGGLWRMPLDGGVLRFDVNTGAPGSEFGVNYRTPLAMTKEGNVGIGTTAPAHKLDIATGGANVKTYLYGLETTVNTTGGWARSMRFRNENNNVTSAFGSLNGNAYIATGFDISADPTGYQNQRLTVTTAGNVGIGTTAPAYKLDIQETRTDTSGTFSTVSGKQIINPPADSSAIHSAQYLEANVPADNSANFSSFIDALFALSHFQGSGNITYTKPTGLTGIFGEARYSGVGTLSKAAGLAGEAKLASSGTLTEARGLVSWVRNISTGTITTGYGVDLYTENAGGGAFTNYYGFRMPSMTGISNKWGIYIEDSAAQNYFAGNVGIGTTRPQRKLDLVNDVTGLSFEAGMGSPNSGVIRFGDNTGWKLHFGRSRESVGGALNFGTAGVLMTIQDNGNVGIGTTAPGNILTVVQNSATDPIADAWTVYSTPDSKIILGTADEELMNYLEIFKNLPVYKWKRSENEPTRLSVIAVSSTPSEILAYDSKGNIQGIDLEAYIGFLHEVMKAQQKQIEELKAEIQSLKSKGNF